MDYIAYGNFTDAEKSSFMRTFFFANYNGKTIMREASS